MTTALKPCPFCGNLKDVRLEEDIGSRYVQVVCAFDADHETDSGCGAGSGYAPTTDEAVAQWNSRTAPEDVTKAEVARLRDALLQVKSWVCGEKMPNWETDATTYISRGRIADICDIALGLTPTPQTHTP